MFNPDALPLGEFLFPTPTVFAETQFFGRDTDVAHIRQYLDAGSSVAISGKRRIGRSWILQHLRTALSKDKYLVVYDDELKPDTIVPRKASLFLQSIIYALQRALSSHLQPNYSLKLLDSTTLPLNIGAAFWSDLRILHNHLAAIDLVAVILIDEAEALYDFNDEVGLIPAVVKKLASEYQHLRVIVAGFDLSTPEGNHLPLFDAFMHHQLYGIGSEGAYDLIAGQLAAYGVMFESPDAWARVAVLTGEEPALLRLLGQRLVEQARQNNGVIRPQQVQIAAEEFFSLPQATLWMSSAWQFLGEKQPILDLITVLAHDESTDFEAQKKLLQKVAQQFYLEEAPDAIHRDLRRLHALGFLAKHEETNCLQFSSGLLREWIRRNRLDPKLQ